LEATATTASSASRSACRLVPCPGHEHADHAATIRPDHELVAGARHDCQVPDPEVEDPSQLVLGDVSREPVEHAGRSHASHSISAAQPVRAAPARGSEDAAARHVRERVRRRRSLRNSSR
jgi:hypothetical protein